jgi:hypothetical protein
LPSRWLMTLFQTAAKILKTHGRLGPILIDNEIGHPHRWAANPTLKNASSRQPARCWNQRPMEDNSKNNFDKLGLFFIGIFLGQEPSKESFSERSYPL